MLEIGLNLYSQSFMLFFVQNHSKIAVKLFHEKSKTVS